MGINHTTVRSFRFAFEGIKVALKKEPNLRIHLIVAIVTISLGAFLRISSIEWLILVLTIFFVIILELLNTVIESVVNLISPEIKGEAKIAKDISAAVVLVSSFVAIIVGLIIFLPKLIALRY